MKAVAGMTKRQCKSQRVQNALLEYWRTLSDREIALALTVSNRTVSQHRKRLEEEGRILPRFESTQPVGACLYEVSRVLGKPLTHGVTSAPGYNLNNCQILFESLEIKRS
jgi:hypothetical protein